MNRTIILGNGQIQPRKRFDVFASLAEKFPEREFIWVGGMPFKSLGADSGKLQKITEHLPKNLRITGVIPLESVRKYFVLADIFVLPSMQENHPIAVLEAAGAGLPILLRDIPEYDDTFRGYVAMAETDGDFEKQLERLLEDPQYFSGMQR